MNRWQIGVGLVAVTLLACGTARADRTPSTRVPSPPPATGSRPDITVPYTTDGRSTLMYGGKVAAAASIRRRSSKTRKTPPPGRSSTCRFTAP